MFVSLGIATNTQAFKRKKDQKNADPAHILLFKAVEAYFANGCTDFDPKVRCTSLPPLYFQHPGTYSHKVSLNLTNILKATQ
jgi:hypothetical protein